MHFLHIIKFLFTSRGKGILLLPITIISISATFVLYETLRISYKLEPNQYTNKLVLGGSMFLVSIVNSFMTKNYTLNAQREREYYEEEGEYMYIKVSLWTRIFIGLGVVIILAAIADMYKLG